MERKISIQEFLSGELENNMIYRINVMPLFFDSQIDILNSIINIKTDINYNIVYIVKDGLFKQLLEKIFYINNNNSFELNVDNNKAIVNIRHDNGNIAHLSIVSESNIPSNRYMNIFNSFETMDGFSKCIMLDRLNNRDFMQQVENDFMNKDISIIEISRVSSKGDMDQLMNVEIFENK